ncbi:MAG: hypothetical protein QOG64_239 [Acidimicrobiaceae bacterium]|nr:hypothetical protein [Acidimicrobiaceae bacterium]
MSTRRIVRLLAAMALSCGWIAVMAGPAPAAPAPGSSTFTAPRAGETVATSNPHVAVHVDVTPNCIRTLHLELLSLADPKNPVPVDRRDLGGDDKSSADFSWTASLGNKGVNGAYRFTARADVLLLCNDQGDPGTYDADPVDFKIAAPPAAPTGVRAKPAADRSVTLSWNANTEPDLTGYTVYRTASNAAGCVPPGTVDAIGGASETAYTDRLDPNDPGGPVCYYVTAARRGADDASPAVLSGYSKWASVTLPPADPNGASSAPGGSAAGSSGSSGSPGTPGGAAGISGFSGGSISGSSNKASARPQVAQPPDPGFNPNLPFQGANDKEDGAGDPAAVAAAVPPSGALPLRGASSTDRVRTLGAFAGGLVAAVVLGHLLLLRREVKRGAPLEAVG